jgi:23S rRNA pseudouridine1911/1915/1917 synthase
MGMNDGYDYRERLALEAEGLTLLAHLVDRYRHSTAEEWAARIDAGQLFLDGRQAAADALLRRGVELVWRRPPWEEPAVPGEFALIYEDGELLAVAKPAGLPTLPGAGFLHGTLLHLVRAHVPDAAPLHRLGRWTSGLVLFARTPRARGELLRQWSAREVGKRYRALASGLPSWERLTIDTPIGPVPHGPLGTIHAASAGGKTALSRVTVLERRTDAFLCDVAIDTGRPHQIRIHLAAAGHPLVGDPLYRAGGLPDHGSLSLPGDPGYLLHSAELSFRHPCTGRRMVIRCQPPAPLCRSGEPEAAAVSEEG